MVKISTSNDSIKPLEFISLLLEISAGEQMS